MVKLMYRLSKNCERVNINVIKSVWKLFDTLVDSEIFGLPFRPLPLFVLKLLSEAKVKYERQCMFLYLRKFCER